MIVTVTPSPALDRTYHVATLTPGAFHRATRTTAEASGKGVNVARALADQGVQVSAVVALGRDGGAAAWQALSAQHGFLIDAVDVPGTVRTNTTIAGADGVVTKVNEQPSDWDEDAVRAMVAAVESRLAVAPVEWVACCGTIAAGWEALLLRGIVAVARRYGARVALDASGAALKAAVDARPDLIKPNDEELAELVGRALPTVTEVVVAAQELATGTGIGVLASCGAAGAVLVQDGITAAARPPEITVVNSVGAGDASLAGYLAAALRSAAPQERLTQAVAWGSAACLTGKTAGFDTPTVFPAPEDVLVLADERTSPPAASQQPNGIPSGMSSPSLGGNP